MNFILTRFIFLKNDNKGRSVWERKREKLSSMDRFSTIGSGVWFSVVESKVRFSWKQQKPSRQKCKERNFACPKIFFGRESCILIPGFLQTSIDAWASVDVSKITAFPLCGDCRTIDFSVDRQTQNRAKIELYDEITRGRENQKSKFRGTDLAFQKMENVIETAVSHLESFIIDSIEIFRLSKVVTIDHKITEN